jgi:hypothetical protein
MIFERVRNYILFRINCLCTILFWSFLAELALNFGFPALVLIIIAWMHNFATLALAYDSIRQEIFVAALRWCVVVSWCSVVV